MAVAGVRARALVGGKLYTYIKMGKAPWIGVHALQAWAGGHVDHSWALRNVWCGCLVLVPRPGAAAAGLKAAAPLSPSTAAGVASGSGSLVLTPLLDVKKNLSSFLGRFL